MLEPENRQLLLDALRPPPGYSLSAAVGTTFSLDLLALLTAPLAFALFDSEADDGHPDPIALLEAVRRHAESITIFCQAGQIALPAQFERVLAYVEESVHSVLPPKAGRVFHPKLWAIRFTAPDDDDRYRLLCLSRNLTFDRSWDTILMLEGEVAGRRVVAANRPLVSFLRALPGLAIADLPRARRMAIEALASDLERVEFSPPSPFDAVAFWPFGLRERQPMPFPVRSIGLVVSPFLGGDLAARFGGDGGTKLVSRAESLDALPASALERFEPFTLSGDAFGSDVEDSDATEATSEIVAERAGCSLRGLHAKLYVTEDGRRASVWTGSANATAAAFGGNVEFLVELQGPKSACGVDALLGGDGVTFETLLEPYTRSSDEAVEPSAQELLERRLDGIRHAVAAVRFTATVEQGGEGETYGLRLTAGGSRPEELADVDGAIWPISRADARRPVGEAFGGGAEFGDVSLERLTSFFGIELTLSEGSASATARFVVNADLVGAPSNRGELLLGRLLESRDKVLRYLLLLLADDGFAADGGGSISRLLSVLDAGGGWNDPWSIPLLESMVRALAASPERLDHVGRLIGSLRLTEEGAALLPEGLDEIWPPIWEARQERARR
jgi:hypothetical protein